MKGRREKGLTLIEILFAFLMFLLCVGIVVSTFSSSMRTYFQGQKKIEISNMLRTSLDIFSAELRQCDGSHSISSDGRTINFFKYDQRKGGKHFKIQYRFDKEAHNVERTDYDGSVVQSTAIIGQDLDDAVFAYDSGTGRFVITLSAKNPSTEEKISLQTGVTMRNGLELQAVKAIGRKDADGRSSLLRVMP